MGRDEDGAFHDLGAFRMSTAIILGAGLIAVAVYLGLSNIAQSIAASTMVESQKQFTFATLAKALIEGRRS